MSNSFSKIFSLFGERVGGLLFCVKMPKPQAAYWGNSKQPFAATSPARDFSAQVVARR
ncbi:hypothetical protein ACNKHN_23500 [Shigella flexneri]